MKSNHKSRFILFIIFISTIISCNQKNNLQPSEGFLKVDGGKIWYKIVGEGNKTPLILLHGGPGVPSFYLKPLQALSNNHPVIFYDQLGCGKSDRITDTSLMTMQHFIDELKQVVTQLGVKDFYLYGQSWGTMLATDYYLQHPEGIKALILSSPALSIPMWSKDADTLISTLPDSVQSAIRINEKNQTTNSPEYQSAMKIYYEKFLARKLPWSPDIDSSFSQMGESVYNYMEGPSEFTLSGTIKNYDRTDRLHEIKIPTLFIAGEYDEARPSTVKYYQSLVPNAKFALIENAGHLTMQDNPEKNIEVIEEFLDGIEKDATKTLRH